MNKLKVNHKNYALFDYSPYLDNRDKSVPRPAKVTYDLGDVVYIKSENSIGVVLGCIHEDGEEVRTDMDGMQWFGNLEPATMEHFNLPDVRFCERLKEDLQGTLVRKYNDELLDALVAKYERRGAEVKRGYLFYAKENKCVVREHTHAIYLVDENGKEGNRIADFTKKSDAKEFAEELGLTIIKK